MQDVQSTIISQYTNSPTLCGITSRLNDALDPSADIVNLIVNRLSLSTAVRDGLDSLGAKVGVSRYVQIPDTVQPAWFGFDEAFDPLDVEHGPQPFDCAPFFAEATTSTYRLEDDEYRKLVRVKALANIYPCTIKNLNKFYNLFFGDRGPVFVRVDSAMAASVVFSFPLTDSDRALLASGAFPAQAGVSYSIVEP